MNLATSPFEHFTQLLDSAKKFKAIPREKTFFDTAIRNHYENPTTELLEFFLTPQFHLSEFYNPSKSPLIRFFTLPSPPLKREGVPPPILGGG